MRSSSPLCVLLGSLVLAYPASSQETGQALVEPAGRTVVAAAIDHLASSMVAGGTLPVDPVLVIDPAVLDWTGEPAVSKAPAAGVWRSEDVEPLARAVGAAVAPLADVHSCDPDAFPPRCTLSGADAVFLFGQPDLAGTVATVTVRSVHRSIAAPDTRQAYRIEVVLELERTDSGSWRVTGTKAARAS